MKHKEVIIDVLMSVFIPLFMALLLLLFTGVIEVQAEEERSIDLSVSLSGISEDGTTCIMHKDITLVGNGIFEVVSYGFSSDTTYSIYSCIKSNEKYTLTVNGDEQSCYTKILGESVIYYTSPIWTYISLPATSISMDAPNFVDAGTYENFDALRNDFYSTACIIDYVSTTCTYNSTIPTPQVVLSQLGEIGFNNKTDDYYIEMQGRWRTAEDIDIYSENLVWKYKFLSRIDSDLTTWVSQDDRRLATEADLYLTQLGADNFATLLSSHPSIERNIYTSNALGEVLSGFAHQKAQFINYLDNCAFFPINSPEIYVRYYTVDDTGNVEYGKWCHAYVTMPTNGKMSTFTEDLTDGFAYVSTQSDKGLTEDEFTYVEDLEDSRLETDASISNNADGTVYVPDANMDTSQLLDLLSSMFEQSQAFFNLFAQVFSFFPEWLTGLIFSSLGVMVVIGVWKFIRG